MPAALEEEPYQGLSAQDLHKQRRSEALSPAGKNDHFKNVCIVVLNNNASQYDPLSQSKTLSESSEERVHELTGCSYSCAYDSYEISQKSSSSVVVASANNNSHNYYTHQIFVFLSPEVGMQCRYSTNWQA